MTKSSILMVGKLVEGVRYAYPPPAIGEPIVVTGTLPNGAPKQYIINGVIIGPIGEKSVMIRTDGITIDSKVLIPLQEPGQFIEVDARHHPTSGAAMLETTKPHVCTDACTFIGNMGIYSLASLRNALIAITYLVGCGYAPKYITPLNWGLSTLYMLEYLLAGRIPPLRDSHDSFSYGKKLLKKSELTPHEELIKCFLLGEAEDMKGYCCSMACEKTPSLQVDGLACIRCREYSVCLCACVRSSSRRCTTDNFTYKHAVVCDDIHVIKFTAGKPL